jgi:hypothetical protein
VTWHSAEPEQEPQQNETQSPPPEPPADNEVEDSEPEEEEESDEESDNDSEGTMHSPFVFRDRQTSVSAQADDEIQEPAQAPDMLHVNGTLMSYTLNETGLPQMHVLSGNWSMTMNDTAVTGFSANFTMAPLGGAGGQAFSLSNLTAVSMPDMVLENGTLTMRSALDYNDTGQTTRVNATITVQNLGKIVIDLDAGRSDTPIHGAVDKVVRVQDGQAQVMARQFDMI